MKRTLRTYCYDQATSYYSCVIQIFGMSRFFNPNYKDLKKCGLTHVHLAGQRLLRQPEIQSFEKRCACDRKRRAGRRRRQHRVAGARN